jgi:RNA polymerase sigma factor (sigma-70 family)
VFSSRPISIDGSCQTGKPPPSGFLGSPGIPSSIIGVSRVGANRRTCHSTSYPRDSNANPEALYAAKERQARLLRAMSAMCVDDRMLLSLKFTAQRTNREVADILGISEAAVSMRLLRALRRLRERLADLGVS